MSSSSGSVATSAFISQQLSRYSACDISDALLKLKVPGAGYLAELRAISSTDALTIAPVSTILFAAKGRVEDEATLAVPANVPKDTHWADLTEPDTFVVMKQPPGQTNAICGGIMALRMKVRGVKGIIVAGRVRDVQELQSTNLPVIMSPPPPLPVKHPEKRGATFSHGQILALGQSTVGAGGGSIPWALQVPLEINGVVVRPGDVAFQDPVNGVVILPHEKVQQVLDMLPKLTAADDKVKEAVLGGMSVYDAFKLHR
ncbi:Demethylmenaquinone methyltransferase [Moelleriella libera RCEF 2490]|uniref:Demethylmenaquinone methyltransferase n=1 Tax=Moelleriella libera RCEF 2490 TaxID=1081109 RepID=A0A168CJU2_9HYPO|nr:Demethylmenaquinone methyltransferase [Moelleriella libera RCEF 2490]